MRPTVSNSNHERVGHPRETQSQNRLAAMGSLPTEVKWLGSTEATWKAHPVLMAMMIGLRVWIEMLLNKRVVVRVQPDEPNPLAGLTDPTI